MSESGQKDDGFRECHKCGETLFLRDECEWPDNPAEILCDECTVGQMAQLREALSALRQRCEELTAELVEARRFTALAKADALRYLTDRQTLAARCGRLETALKAIGERVGGASFGMGRDIAAIVIATMEQPEGKP